MDTEERLQKALELSKEAIEYDNAQQYEKAFDYYLRALDQWSIVCKYQKNPQLQEKFFKKMKEYVTRAETLKEIISKGPVNCEISSSKPSVKNAEAVNLVESAITAVKPNIKWDDIAGLESAKDALQEAVILPIRFPNLFTGKLKPWHGILLYGPPGTGKTYLAQACATECDATFIAVSSSDVMSKWQGESEKFVKSLFQAAKEKAPSVIFIDEIDSMCSARSDHDNEASRRVKTEFLIQMQGISNTSDGILVLAATNLPWALDSAIIRRFEKRIYIPLPDERARKVLIKLALGDSKHQLTDEDISEIAKRTEGYSGSDLSVLVRDALMQPVRKCKLATHFKEVNVGGRTLFTPCSPGDPCKSKRQCNLMSIDPERLLPPVIARSDFMAILANSRSSVIQSDLGAYAEWTRQYGQEGS